MNNNIDSLKQEVVKWEKRLKVAKEADEKKFAEKKLNAAKEALTKAEGDKKKNPKKVDSHKIAITKFKGDKPAKVTKTVEYNGKTYTNQDKEFCEILLKKFAERRANMKKANKKYKTVSVSSKIGREVALAITKAIDNVPVAQIKDSPRDFFMKVTKVEKAGNDFVASLKDLLGADFDKEDFKSELAAIKELVDKIKTKYKK